MSLILPAFSSPDLKAFPLCSKSSKSSEGGQMSCLLSSELSAAAIASAHISAQPRPARLCDLFRSAYAPLHKSHRLAKVRIKVVEFVVLNHRKCQSRKDPYLPLEPQCVRLLPRPHGLAPYGICGRFPPLLTQTRKPSPNTIGQRWISRFGVSASAPSSPACRWCRELYKCPCAEVLAGLPSRFL